MSQSNYYVASAWQRPAHLALAGTRRADVCVVGGGFTGISAALHFAEAGYDVVLLEAGRIAGGASGRNGGQIGSGQRRGVLDLEARLGLDAARRLWALAEAVAEQAERFDVFASLEQRRFPGRRRLRHPLLVSRMLYCSLRDRL